MIKDCLIFIVVVGSVNTAWITSDPQSTGITYHWSSEMKTWNESRIECERNGWLLATVLSYEDHDNLKQFVTTQGLSTWIGLYLTTFAIPEGVWTDGSFLTFNKTSGYWADHEPRSGQPCVHIWDAMSFKWDDHFCDAPLNFVCQSRDLMDSKDFQVIGEKVLISLTDEPSNEENLMAATNALDQLLMADLDTFEQSKDLSREILDAFDDFLGRYQGEDFEERKENVNVAVRKARNLTMIFGNDTSTESQMDLKLTIELLDELRLKSGNITSSLQVQSILYKSGDLFQANNTRYEDSVVDFGNHSYEVERFPVPAFGENPQMRLPPQLVSHVISAQVSEIDSENSISKMNTSVLDHKVRIAAEVCENSSSPSFPSMKVKSRFSCVFWDTESHEWSDRGCRVIKLENSVLNCSDTNSSLQGKRITCECDHMTHFAIILDTTYINAPKYLDYLTVAGCSISAFFHVAAVFTILCFRHMRKETHKRIICNISINLFAMNLTFLIGIDKTENFSACIAASLVLHFFILAAWCWMLCEALYLFNALFLQYRGETRFFLFGGTLAYVLPASGAIAAFFASGNQYLSQRYCWLSPSLQKYAIYAPIGCIMGINVIILIAAIYAMTCGFKKKSSSGSDIRQTIRRIVYLVFLLGIPWVFGVLMLLSQYSTPREIFSVLFAVSNLLQGIVIFVAFCGTDEKFRKWARGVFGPFFEQMHPLARKSFTVQTEQQRPSTNDFRETMMTTNGTSTPTTPRRMKQLPFRSGWS